MEKFFTCKQIAERYKVKIKTVWAWIETKKLPAVRVAGGRYRIRLSDLEAFEKAHYTVTDTRKCVYKKEVQTNDAD